MLFYYGYISGTYRHNKNNVGMLPCTDINSIIQHTYCRNTEDSKFGNFGLDDGWSCVFADKVDWDLTVVADPIRTVLELLYDRKFDEAKYLIEQLFRNNVSTQEISISCCDKLMKYDDDGKIYDFLCETLPLFKTTMVNWTANMLRQKEKEKKEEKARRKSTYGITTP